MDNFDLKKYLGNNPLLNEANYLGSKRVDDEEAKNLISRILEKQGWEEQGQEHPRPGKFYNNPPLFTKTIEDNRGNSYVLYLQPRMAFTDSPYVRLSLSVMRGKKGLKKLFSKDKFKEIEDLEIHKQPISTRDSYKILGDDPDDQGKWNELRKMILQRVPSAVKSMENEILNKLNRASDPENYTE